MLLADLMIFCPLGLIGPTNFKNSDIYMVYTGRPPCGDKRCKCCRMPRRHKVLTHGQECLFRKVTSVSIHSFVEWLDTFSYVLQPADVTVKEVHHIRCFAIDIAKDLILLSWTWGPALPMLLADLMIFCPLGLIGPTNFKNSVKADNSPT
jgi:hypothetical protein